MTLADRKDDVVRDDPARNEPVFELLLRFSDADTVDGLQNEDGGWRGTWPWECRCRDSRGPWGTCPLEGREAGRPNDSLYRISPAHRGRDFNDAANGSKCVEHRDQLQGRLREKVADLVSCISLFSGDL